ncbi:ABC transporter ATP-binding protein [Lacticaseibacillus sp. GG6-2]
MQHTFKQHAKISLENVTKQYTSRRHQTLALRNVDLAIKENEFVSIVGPSGCGKSTMLRMIAGLDHASSGSVTIDSSAITAPGPDRGLVFQAYSLFPWMTVAKNIEYGLKMKKMPRIRRNVVVDHYLEKMDLQQFKNSYPNELSGGMQQRVAIARALANTPEVLLMDEPFGALDPATKGNMQLLVRELWQVEKPTVIFITHDIEEAVFISQRVIVMKTHPGEIVANMPVDLPLGRELTLKNSSKFKRLVTEVKTTLAANHSAIGEAI